MKIKPLNQENTEHPLTASMNYAEWWSARRFPTCWVPRFDSQEPAHRTVEAALYKDPVDMNNAIEKLRPAPASHVAPYEFSSTPKDNF